MHNKGVFFLNQLFVNLHSFLVSQLWLNASELGLPKTLGLEWEQFITQLSLARIILS